MITLCDVEKMCLDCTKCDLHKTRGKVVFGGGNPCAPVMLIAEAPGEQEDIQGTVFVGPAGKLLDKMLACIGFDRESVYISNIIKCHPPKNRNPYPEERSACLPYLRAQVKLIHPKIIVCLGRVSAQTVIRPDFKITKEHGTWIERAGYFMTATYHPSALLRDPSKKRDAYEDLKSIREKYDILCSE